MLEPPASTRASESRSGSGLFRSELSLAITCGIASDLHCRVLLRLVPRDPKINTSMGPLSSHDGARRARDRNSHAVVDVLHVVVDGRPSIGRRPERRDIVIGRVGDAFKPKIVLVVEPRENRAPAQAGVSAMGSEA